MKPLILSQKDLLELKYWVAPDCAREVDLRNRYVAAFGGQEFLARMSGPGKAVLEIGTGPWWGLLPLLGAGKRIAVDPLIDAFDAAALLAEREDIQYYSERFEWWDSNDLFDAVISTNALDHGEMGFYLLPKMAKLLKPGGRIYLHVQMRPPELLNLIHDHALTLDQLDKHLSYTALREVSREVFPKDVNGEFWPAVVGVWEMPA